MHKIWDNYPEIKEELIKVIALMDENAKCKDQVIESSIKEMIHSTGKMIRPGFTIIASKFGKYESEKAQVIAAVMELFHMATLVHDDIIDDAKLRRGKESIQSKYGKNYAVYIGDYLFCICFKLLAQTASIYTIQIDTKAMSRICLGEVEQLNSRFDLAITVKDYLKRVSGKTAELFSISLYVGAAESGCDKKLSRLFWNIGHNIGMAFQIIDDILDYAGDEVVIGKDSANDIKDGLYTLPIIYAMEDRPKQLIELLEKKEYKEEEIQEIIRLTRELGGIEKARDLARKYTQKAYKLIDKLPKNEYKQMLKELTETLLERTY